MRQYFFPTNQALAKILKTLFLLTLVWANQAFSIDYDALISAETMTQIQQGSLCRADTQSLFFVTQALEKFYSKWVTSKNGRPSVDYLKYKALVQLQGKEGFFANYINQAASAGAKKYFANAAGKMMDLSIVQGRSRNIFIGDSLMAMYGDYSERNKPSWYNSQFNAGIGGDTLDFVNARLQYNVLIHKPKQVIVSIGGNNLLTGCLMDPQFNTLGEQVLEGIKNMAIRLRLSGVQRVLFINVPPTGYRYVRSSIPEFNKGLAAMNVPGVFVLDQYSQLVVGDGEKNPLSFYNILDAVHLSDWVYKTLWTPVLGSLIM